MNIDRHFVALKDSGLECISHEDGWTLMETSAANRLSEELEALRLVQIEARELVGEADATGQIPMANLNALRALLWRADMRKKSRASPPSREERA